jgi:hypothetical protein
VLSEESYDTFLEGTSCPQDITHRKFHRIATNWRLHKLYSCKDNYILFFEDYMRLIFVSAGKACDDYRLELKKWYDEN